MKKFLRKMSGRGPETDLEQPSKNQLTAAEEYAIIAAIRPSIARQRAQSRERERFSERRASERRASEQKYPTHPRMSQARQAAARAYWDAPLTGGEWHQHPTTGKLVPREVLDDEYISTPASPTDRFHDDSEPGSRENGRSSPNSLSSDPMYAAAVVVERPTLKMDWNAQSSRSKDQPRMDSVVGPLQVQNKTKQITQDWKTPGEETRAYIAQLDGSAKLEETLALKRSRSVPSARSITSNGKRTIVQIDGASMMAVAGFEVPARSNLQSSLRDK